MSKHAEIKRLLKQLVGGDFSLPILGEVVSVEGDSCTVKVSNIGGSIDIPDVRLKASIDGSENCLLLTPKKGTLVRMISLTGGLEDLAIIHIDEIESISYKQNGLEVLIDSTDKKVMIKNNQVSLVDVFSDLKTLLSTFKVIVPTPGGPAPSLSVDPSSITKLTQFETKFKSLLK
jgi:hypothetical protein